MDKYVLYCKQDRRQRRKNTVNRAEESVQSSSYSAMGHNRHDYEPCYACDEQWPKATLHCHDFYELYIHFRGANAFCIFDNVYPIEPNQLMIVPPFCLHGMLHDQVLYDYERAFVYVSPTLMKAAGVGLMDLEYLFSVNANSGENQYILSDEDAMTCKRLILEMRDGLEDTSPMGLYANHIKLMQVLQIFGKTVQQSRKTVSPIVVNEAMHEIIAYINESFTKPIKLEELARQFGVSKSFLSHEFVKYAGRSVYDYVLYRRVLLGKELINSGISFNEIAYQCGFNDYSCFLRAFKKATGISPQEFRKRLKDGNG